MPGVHVPQLRSLVDKVDPPLSSLLKDYHFHVYCGGLPGGLNGKISACNAGDPCLSPGLGRSPEEGNGNPPQYSCLENSMDREFLAGYSPFNLHIYFPVLVLYSFSLILNRV